MLMKSSLQQAAKLLVTKCQVVPEKYAMYNGGFLFLAYLPNSKNKENNLSPYYLVDLKTRSAGPFSPAFDFDGFFRAVESMKTI